MAVGEERANVTDLSFCLVSISCENCLDLLASVLQWLELLALLVEQGEIRTVDVFSFIPRSVQSGLCSLFAFEVVELIAR